MKRIHNETNNILDLGEVLVIIPTGIVHDLDAGHWLDGQPVEVSGFTRRQTRAGREAVEVQPGTGYTLRLREGNGDRSWGDWNDRAPARSQHGEVFAYAVPTSNGGGCWFEVTITPTAGYETAYDASIADELAV